MKFLRKIIVLRNGSKCAITWINVIQKNIYAPEEGNSKVKGERTLSGTQFVVNPNPQYIDKSVEKYIFLNESIYRDENDDFFKGKYRFLKYPMLDEYQYMERKKYIARLSDRVIEHYGKIVNTKFGLHLSVRQWKYYIGIWIEDFLFDAYDRYNKILAIDTEEIFIICNDEESVLINQQQFGFINGYDPDFQMQLYSKLFSFMGMNVRIKHVSKNKKRLHRGYEEFRKWKNRFIIILKDPERIKKKLYEKYNPEVLTGNTRVLVVESRMPKIMEEHILDQCDGKVEFVGAQYFWQRQNFATNKLVSNYDDRKKFFTGFSALNEFEKLVDKLLIYFMPITFFEALPIIHEIACTMTKDWSYKKIYHSAHITELFAMCCALMKDKDTEISDIQHSGVYGDLFGFGYKEYRTWDRFLTWGWKNQEPTFNCIYPVAMSRFPIKAKKNYQVKNKILMVTCMPELCDSGAGWNFDSYISEQKKFIEGLSSDLRKQLVLRLRVSDKRMSGGLVDWCKKHYPEIRYENMNEIAFVDSVMESKLLVCDYYGTPHLEAMMLGKPVVMFEGAHVNIHNFAIKKYLRDMEKEGIYKKNGSTLAAEISKHEDLNNWLKGENIKKIIEEYLKEMTSVDKDIVGEWVKEFLL